MAVSLAGDRCGRLFFMYCQCFSETFIAYLLYINLFIVFIGFYSALISVMEFYLHNNSSNTCVKVFLNNCK